MIKLTPPIHSYSVAIDKGGKIVWVDNPINTWVEQDKHKSQGFGESLLDYSKYGLLGHNGEDHAFPLGTPIFPMHEGKITIISNDVALGYFVQVTSLDGMYRTRYCHMKEGSIPPNLIGRVTTNTKIGEVGTTGNSTGNHLHSDLKELENGRVKNYDNGYFGAIDFSQWKVDRNKNTMKLVIKENQQYLRGLDGKDRAIYNVSSLQDFIEAGIIENPVAEAVDKINPTGREWISLEQE